MITKGMWVMDYELSHAMIGHSVGSRVNCTISSKNSEPDPPNMLITPFFVSITVQCPYLIISINNNT